MFVGVPQRYAVSVVLLGSLLVGHRAVAAVPSTQPAPGVEMKLADDGVEADARLFNLSLPTDVISSNDENGATTQSASVNTPPPPRTIEDPVPPAFWSGLSVLALAGAFLSIRRLRRALR